MTEYQMEDPPADLYVIEQPVNLFSDLSVKEAIAAVESLLLNPNLIVFDTYARSMTGGDENSAKDVGVVVASLDDLRCRLRSAVVVVHHSGKRGSDERGSSALTGAVDTKIRLGGSGVTNLTLSFEKQKNFESGGDIHLSLETVAESLVPRLRTGSGSGPTGVGIAAAAVVQDKDAIVRQEIVTVLTEAANAGDLPLTQTGVLKRVRRNASIGGRVLHEMADDEGSPVVGLKNGKRILYNLNPALMSESDSDSGIRSDSVPPTP